MGVSTNAVLFYGYCWDDAVELLPDDWEDHALRARGHVNPWDAYHETGIESLADSGERNRRGKEWCEQHRAELDRWYELKVAVQKESGCDIGNHCSGSHAMPYVFVTDSEVRVRRGYPWAFDPSELVAESHWEESVEKFLSDLGIEKPDGQTRPQWWLVSYWSE